MDTDRLYLTLNLLFSLSCYVYTPRRISFLFHSLMWLVMEWRNSTTFTINSKISTQPNVQVNHYFRHFSTVFI